MPWEFLLWVSSNMNCNGVVQAHIFFLVNYKVYLNNKKHKFWRKPRNQISWIVAKDKTVVSIKLKQNESFETGIAYVYFISYFISEQQSEGIIEQYTQLSS